MLSLAERFAQAQDFPDYLGSVTKNKELWQGVYERARISPELLEAALEIPESWNLLALSEDWCGDAVNVLPVVAKLAELHAGFDLRVLGRDEHLDIMDAHLTNGRSRSIPIVLLLDENFEERGWWGPRPEEIQTWVLNEGLAMDSKDRYKVIRRWYARDRGETTVRELLDLMKEVSVAC